VPYKSNSRTSGPKQQSVNDATIRALGFKQFTLLIGQTRFVHLFLLTDIANPIQGIYFIKKFNLVTHTVLFAGTNTDILRDTSSCPCPPAAAPSVSAAAPPELDPSVRLLLQDFPGLLAPASGAPHPHHQNHRPPCLHKSALPGSQQAPYCTDGGIRKYLLGSSRAEVG